MSRYGSLFTGKTSDENSSVPKQTQQYQLLIVDDEPNVLRALQRVFKQENYKLFLAGNAEEAIRVLGKENCQVVISDFKMPGMNGAELLKKIKSTYPDTIRIMLTGHADTTAVMGAVNEGAVYKFILKPWNDDDLRITVALALEQYELIQTNKLLKTDINKKSKELSALTKLAITNRSQLAIMLNKRGLLNDQQVQELHRLQQMRKESIIKLIFEKKWITEKEIRDVLRKDLLIEEVSLPEFQVENVAIDLIPKSFCQRQWVVPLKIQGRRLLLAVADPLDNGLVDDLRFASGLEIQVVMADVAAIKEKIDQVYGLSTNDFTDLEAYVTTVDPFENIEVVIDDEDDCSLEELLRSTEEPPAIRLVNAIITEAVRLNVSDIHIQPRTKNVVVRYRIDGVLVDKIQVPTHFLQSLVSRIKVMAELDIAERRRPQDGRITIKTPMRIVDLRISTLPTITGEKIVMRILDRNSAVHRVEELGFSPGDKSKIFNMITKPQGIILSTGPTGSGKTTTLYSLLQQNASPTKNYVTIEDPVEFFLEMAGQVYVREKIGLNFATVLRAILRQDPDVVLLGEIRDYETAEVAFHAALTGHLVFSTLHTNSAVATIARLIDIGLKPFVIASALEGIIAQRLVRKICMECRKTATDNSVLEKLGPLFQNSQLVTYKGSGCHKCNNTGYKGRIALFEVLFPDERLRSMIASGASFFELNQLATQQGMSTLLQDAYWKVGQGLTTADEVLRVLGSQATC